MKTKIIKIEISQYVKPKWDEHGEMTPVCFVEFETNKVPVGVNQDGYIFDIYNVILEHTGWAVDDDDKAHISDGLCFNKEAAFKFGADWEYYLQVSVQTL